LHQLGLADSTLVVLTADHGEEFLDHGSFEHGHSLYNELVHVPLIFRGASAPSGVRVKTVVGHVDLAPTLCELAGVEPAPGFAGRSLAGLMRGERGDDRPIVFEGNFWGRPLRGWLQGGYKLILTADGEAELFNMVDDPFEKTDLRHKYPDRVRQMAYDLRLAYKKMLMPRRGNDSHVVLSPEELRRLQSLGYIR
jgi:arylsulfatase A-like enzyme